jgi:hypothetical protein
MDDEALSEDERFPATGAGGERNRNVARFDRGTLFGREFSDGHAWRPIMKEQLRFAYAEGVSYQSPG